MNRRKSFVPWQTAHSRVRCGEVRFENDGGVRLKMEWVKGERQSKADAGFVCCGVPLSEASLVCVVRA